MVTPSFLADSRGSKLQAATLDKWIFPSERNQLTIKGAPLMIGIIITHSSLKSSYFYGQPIFCDAPLPEQGTSGSPCDGRYSSNQ